MQMKTTFQNVLLLGNHRTVFPGVDKMISIAISFAFCFTLNLNAQNERKIDSLKNVLTIQKDTVLINTYRELFFEYIFVDSKLAKPYLDSSRGLSNKLKNKDFIARTTNEYGVYLWAISEYGQAVEVYDTVLQLYEELGNQGRMSAAFNNKGNILRNLGRYNEALESHMASLKIKEDIQLGEKSLAASYWNIANLHGDIGNYETSNEYYRKAQVIYEKLNLEDDLMAIKTNLAINLKNSGQYEEAIPLFKEGIVYYSAHNLNNSLAGSYDSLGQIYLATDSLSQAKRYLEKALAMSQQFGENSLIGLNLRNLGDLYMKENNPALALDYYKRALAISLQANTRKRMILDHKKLSEAYATLGNFKLAYDHHTNYHEVYQEILNEENIERMNALEIQYQSQKKELELIKKNSEIQLFKEREQRAGLQRLFLFILLFVAIALAVAVIYGLRQKMKRNSIKRDALNKSLEFKEKELTTHALHLAHKNEILLDLKSQLESVKSDSKNTRDYQKIINNITIDINNDGNWEQFRSYFEEVHKDFNSKIIKSYPEVSTNDLRLMSLLKMNLSSKEIASILNISPEGVKKARYRLRKKLNLSSEESLQELVIEL